MPDLVLDPGNTRVTKMLGASSWKERDNVIHCATCYDQGCCKSFLRGQKKEELCRRRLFRGHWGWALPDQWKFTNPLGGEATGFGAEEQGELTLCCGPFHKHQPTSTSALCVQLHTRPCSGAGPNMSPNENSTCASLLLLPGLVTSTRPDT